MKTEADTEYSFWMLVILIIGFNSMFTQYPSSKLPSDYNNDGSDVAKKKKEKVRGLAA